MNVSVAAAYARKICLATSGDAHINVFQPFLPCRLGEVAMVVLLLFLFTTGGLFITLFSSPPVVFVVFP